MPKRKPPIPMYFTSLEIENVRCFGEGQQLDLTTGNGRPARWTLLLGENGVGKTTLLQCLAWMRLELVPHGEPVPDKEVPLTRGQLGPALDREEENRNLERLLRAGTHVKLALRAALSVGAKLSSDFKRSKGTVEQREPVQTTAELVFDAKRKLLEYESRGPRIETTLGGEFHDPLIVAYGANRQRGLKNLLKRELEDPVDSSRLSTLTELYDIEDMLGDLDYASKTKGRTSREHRQLERLREVLATILPGDDFKPTDIEIFPPDVLESGEPSGVYLKSYSGLVPLAALSLGYQTTLAWTADLAWRLLKRFPESQNPLEEPAVVLIDEIDLHLHPLWQLRIIDDLSANFPGTQFVATAHSPLMVQVAESANLVLLRRRQADVEIVNDPEVVTSWRVDQILTSELFSVPRARNKQAERLFTRRDELVDKSSRSAAEKAELKELHVQISKLPTAQDPDDQKAMDLIREAAALLKEHRVVEK